MAHSIRSIEALSKEKFKGVVITPRACAARGKVISRGGVYRGVALFTFAMVMTAILESKSTRPMGTWTPRWLPFNTMATPL